MTYSWETGVLMKDMIGLTFTSVKQVGESIVFENAKFRFTFHHEQDCCETVSIEDIIGDLEDLEGCPLLVASEKSNVDDPPLSSGEESYTWTFYTFATYKGFVDVRFYGASNGYYSESISLHKEELG